MSDDNMNDLITEARRWANGHPNRRSGELMRELADALEAATRERAAVPDAATERFERAEHDRLYWRRRYQSMHKRAKAAEAERDAALAAAQGAAPQQIGRLDLARHYWRSQGYDYDLHGLDGNNDYEMGLAVADAALAALAAAQGAAPQAEGVPKSTYISPNLPGMIRNLWKSDPSEKSVRTALKLAGDLIQELIDLKASPSLPSSGVDEDD